MAQKKRSKELAMYAAQIYEKTRSCHEVARQLELGSTTVYKMLKDIGVNIPARGSEELNTRKMKFCGDVAAKIAAAYKDGVSMKEISRTFNCGQVAIYGVVERAGIQRRPRGQQPYILTDVERDEIIRLYVDEHWTQSQIARKFGRHQCAIRNVLKKKNALRCEGKAKGTAHGSWNGGKVALSGYVGILASESWPHRSMINSTGYILEHRKVMAEHLGRALERHETVHHKDGNRKNNAIENLQLHSGKHGKGVRLTCRSCGSHDILSEDI